MCAISPFYLVALLIDAENIHHYYSYILRFAESFGTVSIKRAYANWKTPAMRNKQVELLTLGIKLIQPTQIGRNAADQQLNKDGDKLLRAGQPNLFIIVSGDRYYYRLGERILQQRKQVLVIGNRKGMSRIYEKHNIPFAYLDNVVRYFPTAPIS